MSLTRAEKVAAIRQAQREHPDWTHQKIADSLGMKRGTLRNLLNDPDGSKQRKRRLEYQVPCPGCGRLMDGSNGRAATPYLCAVCAIADRRANAYWTNDRLLDAVREWARLFGQPPTASQWHHVQRVNGYRFPALGMCYAPSNPNAPWRSWGAFLEAAGFEGHRGRGAGTWRTRKAAA